MSNPDDDDRTEKDIAAFNEVVDKIQSARSKYAPDPVETGTVYGGCYPVRPVYYFSTACVVALPEEEPSDVP